jgi:hypothetical protein
MLFIVICFISNTSLPDVFVVVEAIETGNTESFNKGYVGLLVKTFESSGLALTTTETDCPDVKPIKLFRTVDGSDVDKLDN